MIEPDGLYHLTTEAEWSRYQEAGEIVPDSKASEGFVHCSWGRQVPGTVRRHFADVPAVLALCLDLAALAPGDPIEEDSYGSGQRFPHVYDVLPVAAVISVTSVGPFDADAPESGTAP